MPGRPLGPKQYEGRDHVKSAALKPLKDSPLMPQPKATSCPLVVLSTIKSPRHKTRNRSPRPDDEKFDITRKRKDS